MHADISCDFIPIQYNVQLPLCVGIVSNDSLLCIYDFYMFILTNVSIYSNTWCAHYCASYLFLCIHTISKVHIKLSSKK